MEKKKKKKTSNIDDFRQKLADAKVLGNKIDVRVYEAIINRLEKKSKI